MNSENNSAGNEALKTFEITYELSIIEESTKTLKAKTIEEAREIITQMYNDDKMDCMLWDRDPEFLITEFKVVE